MGTKQIVGVLILLVLAIVLVVLFAYASKGFRENESYDNHGMRHQDIGSGMDILVSCIHMALLLTAFLLVVRGAHLAITGRPSADALGCVGLGLAVVLALAITAHHDEAWGAAVAFAALAAAGCVYALKQRPAGE